MISRLVAELQGNSGLVGGAGAVGGELAADIIRKQLYGKDVKDLTEEDKRTISALAQLAIAVAGGDVGDAGTAIAAGKNAVENNALNRDDSWQKKGIEGKLSFTEMTEEERAYYLDKLKQINELDEKDDKAFLDACAGSGNNTTAACGAQLAKLRAFKDEYEIYFGRYPYSEYLQDDYNKIIGYLNRYTPDEWSYAINNYAKENNISYEEAASKFKFAMYTQKIADVISLYYGVKGVGIVNGKISALDLAKAEKAINEYNALKQELNAGKGTGLTSTQIKDVKAISAGEANKPFIERGWSAPYDASTQVRQFTAASELNFVRVHTNDNVAGQFIVRADEIKGMTPQQIQQHLALPTIPTFISDVKVPAGTRLQVGRVAPQPNFGAPNKGGTQYQLIDKIPLENFHNTRPLK